MVCPNCNNEVPDGAAFCPHCGNKTQLPRITPKTLIASFLENVVGWDNKYFRTLGTLVRDPKSLFTAYFQGARKKYMNPVAFFAIGMTLSIFLFNSFEDQYLSLSIEAAKAQNEFYAENLGGIYKDERFQQKQIELATNAQRGFLKYFNIASFIALPFNALLAFLVFGKPYNYGEHLAVVTYIQGTSFLISCLMFVLSILVSPFLFTLSLVLLFFLYMYTYTKLYGYSLGDVLLKIVLFVGVLLVTVMVFVVLALAIGYLGGRFGWIDPTDFKP